MHVAESSVRYPITVIVRVLLVIVFGYVCLRFISVELKPDTEQPLLVVLTTFPGAAPEDVEGEITTRFEESISGVSNMLYTQSYSRLGESILLVFYKPGTPFDSFTILGYIMMVGLVVKNDILLITYAVQLIEDHGLERDKALVLASKRRMRPIFMTAIAMVLGMLPLALKTGAGAEIYNGLAMAVVGGLGLATLFTLIFIPVIYTLLDDLKQIVWKVKPLRFEDLEKQDAGSK